MTEIERYRPPALERLDNKTVKGIQNTEMVPKELRGNVPAIIATILKGRSIGLDDMSALTAIHFIEGKPTLSAETKVLLARRAGHSITGEFKDGAVTVTGKRADNGDEISVTWTKEMAQRAGLASKKNWSGYPEAMLWARAVSQLCRMLFADVLAGTSYTPEELEMTPEEQAAAAIGDVSVPATDEEPDDTVEGYVLEGEVVEESGGDTGPITDSAGEPEAQADGRLAAASPRPAHRPAHTEPGSPADDGQGSIFGAMADRAQQTRRKGAKKEDAA